MERLHDRSNKKRGRSAGMQDDQGVRGLQRYPPEGTRTVSECCLDRNGDVNFF